ncbi:hypothetical protein COS31_05550 [Candidatus Roizmanbacteria bacterium CG02_land_8_20_14_3_00_36_15]|nr:MAG: hypothetical protein COS51_01230 [Candidatus Roizmanbacteria bacterium CG03_land_8_20_14_0_80_36_21]PIV37275.1 MAG: hypothetical protein COS31_05550 [Candidatus Roizmanbacteria bacterium CG02_land_8_20_14_3_00_36_15]PIY70330.1 MAG: hypothetical protein COY89_01775 [Candidatus Roizmanbacteria bacterium CG_4_10_14_0_8_um_filter_36_36]
MTKNISKSFSLIEVLVFISILSILFVAAASTTIFALRNMKINEHKILATYYGEELLGWLRGEKENDWNSFLLQSDTFPLYKVYCFKETPISDWGSNNSCLADDWLSAIYKRELYLSKNDDSSQVNVRIVVSWTELEVNYSVPLSTVFTIWE